MVETVSEQHAVDRSPVVFPRHHLVPGETVMWEGRPSIIVYYLRALILLLLGLAFTIVAN